MLRRSGALELLRQELSSAWRRDLAPLREHNAELRREVASLRTEARWQRKAIERQAAKRRDAVHRVSERLASLQAKADDADDRFYALDARAHRLTAPAADDSGRRCRGQREHDRAPASLTPHRNVLIISLSRSGGKLLRSLLDGHDRVRALPFEHWGSRSKNRYFEPDHHRFRHLTTAEKLQACGIPHACDKLKRLVGEVEATRIRAAIRDAAMRACSHAEVYGALARVLFPEAKEDALIVNHCGGLAGLEKAQIDALFGPAHHLLTIRDPRAVYVSKRQMLARRRRHVSEATPEADPLVRSVCKSHRRMLALHAERDGVVQIQFEALVRKPPREMRRVAAALGLEWEDSLARPTQGGEGRSANTSFTRRRFEVDSEAADDWRERIDPATADYLASELDLPD